MIAALILAAGGSTRLGQPKQLLRYQGRSLVRRVTDAALDAGCSPVVVVAGRERKEIALELQHLAVTFVPNDDWTRGIGSSIRAGIEALPDVEAVLILACDQPQVDAALLRRLIEKHQSTGKPMIASAYAQTIGVPALFARSCFPVLSSLGDEEGAKSLLIALPNELATVDFPEGAIDIDTPEDCRRL